MQSRVHDSFSLERQSADRIYTMTDASHLDYQWRMVNNPWHCIDTYCHEGVRSVSLFSFPINQANIWFFIGSTILLLTYPTYKTKNRWRSIETQFQNGAGSVRRALLPMKPVNTAVMNGLSRSPSRLPRMQDQISLTLCSCSFCPGSIHNILSCILA